MTQKIHNPKCNYTKCKRDKKRIFFARDLGRLTLQRKALRDLSAQTACPKNSLLRQQRRRTVKVQPSSKLDLRVSATRRAGVLNYIRNVSEETAVSKGTRFVGPTPETALNQRTQSKHEKSRRMSESCKRRSSTVDPIAISQIRKMIAPAVAQSKTRIHSPGSSPPTTPTPRKRHRSSHLGCTISVDSTSDKLRAVRKSQPDVRVKTRTHGSHLVTGYEGYLWVGPVLFRFTQTTWAIVEIAEECECEVDWLRTDGLPQTNVYTYDANYTNVTCEKRGSACCVTVRRITSCLRVQPTWTSRSSSTGHRAQN